MNTSRRLSLAAVALRVAQLVSAGKVRGALYFPQYAADPGNGELRGAAGGIVMIALGRALAKRLGVELVLVGIRRPAGPWSASARAPGLALGMAIDPTRAGEVDFSPPFMQLISAT